MKFSVIVPSFNQEHYIFDTLSNLIQIKKKALSKNIHLEILLFDSESNQNVQSVIDKFKTEIDHVEVKKDLGQYDAINKGIKLVRGDYWTWLNTDDLLDEEGFFKMAETLQENPSIDYIFGGVDYIDEQGKVTKNFKAYALEFETLTTKDPAIFQPGSFFKTNFTNKIGVLESYRCCFDYEYVLRCMRNGANIQYCDFPLAKFRFYKQSKTGSITPVFIKEQLNISKLYGRKWYNFLTWFSYIRLLKHFLFPRK